MGLLPGVFRAEGKGDGGWTWNSRERGRDDGGLCGSVDRHFRSRRLNCNRSGRTWVLGSVDIVVLGRLRTIEVHSVP